MTNPARRDCLLARSRIGNHAVSLHDIRAVLQRGKSRTKQECEQYQFTRRLAHEFDLGFVNRNHSSERESQRQSSLLTSKSIAAFTFAQVRELNSKTHVEQRSANRLVAFPNSIERLHLVVGSNLGRQPESKPELFATLRQLLRHHRSPSATWIRVPGSTYSDAMAAYRIRCGLQVALFQIARPTSTCLSWLEHLLNSQSRQQSPPFGCCLENANRPSIHEPTIAISPVLWGPTNAEKDALTTKQQSKRDWELRKPWHSEWLAMQIADEIHVINLNPKGRLAKLLDQLPPENSSRIKFIEHVNWFWPSGVKSNDLSAKRQGKSLNSRNFSDRKSSQGHQCFSDKAIVPRKQVASDQTDAWMKDFVYLSHWTRRCYGPWPGQSELEYQTNLLWNRPGADHSAFSTLQRIVLDGRIRASRRWQATALGEVSLTACRWEEMKTLRRFQRHTNRWDFEPYGISIDLEYAVKCGARPITYSASDATTGAISTATDCESDRLIRSPRWSHEKEWTLEGDLCFKNLPANKCRIFVETLEQVSLLQGMSKWPVFTLSELALGPE